jgi:hypothetical protein
MLNLVQHLFFRYRNKFGMTLKQVFQNKFTPLANRPA